jgi:hypothetical protein
MSYLNNERQHYHFLDNVATTLGDLRAKEATDDLLRILNQLRYDYKGEANNKTYDVASTAVALAKIGDKKAWKKLIDVVANPNFPLSSQVIVELNQHLDADLWQKSQEIKLPVRQDRQRIVSIKELAEIYSRETKIPVILHFEPGKDVSKRLPLAPPYKDTKGYPWAYVGYNISLIDGLREIPGIISDGTLPQNFTFVFDDKQIHILTVEKAVEWWRKNILTNK